MHFTAATILSGLAVFASAYTPANTTEAPSGNPIIHPGLNELIPAGKTYDITWTPTAQGSISLLLLRGPSSDVVPILTIADSVPNTGSYSWAVPSTLEADTTHYGVELIVEGTGQYQYSTQCGVSNTNSAASNGTETATWSAGSYTSTVTIVPASWSSSASVSTTSASSLSLSSANSTASSSTWAPVGWNSTATTSSTWSVSSTLSTSTSTSIIVVSESIVPSATETFSAPAGSATAVQTATGAAVANNVARNFGAIVLAGIVGALAL